MGRDMGDHLMGWCLVTPSAPSGEVQHLVPDAEVCLGVEPAVRCGYRDGRVAPAPDIYAGHSEGRGASPLLTLVSPCIGVQRIACSAGIAYDCFRAVNSVLLRQSGRGCCAPQL